MAKPRKSKDAQTDSQLWIIGIGSSAGGLEAVRELAKNLPMDIPAAYVITQHLSPQYKSLLSTLIGRETEHTVEEITDGAEPVAGRIYVTPPNSDLVFKGGRLRLLKPDPELVSPKPSVDRFFFSLAEEVGERAVGIILSGTGSDGAKGMQLIRASGGITLAQDKESAKYDGMLSAAIETGCVDLVLSPLQMATHLANILSSSRDFEKLKTQMLPDSPLQDLLQLLLARTRVDFRDYKTSTIQRRISRRVLALGLENQEEYTKYCRANKEEIDTLFRDLLISVTRFFRDRSEFEALKQTFADIVDSNETGPIRIWVAGCATGEEVYSIAMLLAEAAGDLSKLRKGKVQIFATDIDRTALKIARRGAYSHAIADDVPKELLSKYFTEKRGNFVVVDEIKEIVLFSEHNVAQDPPFLNLNLICCRNVLIYFNTTLQRKVLAKMHFSLKAGGYLFLGTAETVSSAEELYRQTDSGARIFQTRYLSKTYSLPNESSNMRKSTRKKAVKELAEAPLSFESNAERVKLETIVGWLGENAVLVSSNHRILRVFGDLARFVSFNENTRLRLTLEMLNPALATEAKVLVSMALKHNERREGIEHVLDGKRNIGVKMVVFPMAGPELDDGAVLLMFVETEIEEDVGDDADLAEGQMSVRIRKLEKEVVASRDAHRQITEELETSNEELQALNEELQAANEELQSANEELETANEELQSTNEELITVNEELHVNTSVLTDMTQEQAAIVDDMVMPMILVDSAIRIKTASQTAIDFFDIPDIEFNPHLSQIEVPKGFPNLPEQCDKAIRLGQTVLTDFEQKGVEHTLRIHPIVNSKSTVVGAALTIYNYEFLEQFIRKPASRNGNASARR